MNDISLSEGKALLAGWINSCASIAESAQFLCGSQHEFVCKVELPSKQILEVRADRVEMAAALMFFEIQKAVSPALIKDESQSPKTTSNATIERHIVENFESSTTKLRKETIGVSASDGLRLYIQNLASDFAKQEGQLARELLTKGFEEFEERMYTESPSEILNEYQSELDIFQGDKSHQWMVRLDRHLFIRVKMTAKNQGRSLSQIAAGCLAHALNEQPISTRQRSEVAKMLEKFKGPKMRALSEAVGLGEKFSSLLSGVIVGRTVAPPKLVKSLALHFKVPSSVLVDSFQHSFENTVVPAFKADCKPTINAQPISWEVAVKALNISEAEMTRLLKFL